MEHPAELAVHQYMESAVKGNSTMSEDTINQVASDIKEALTKQFNSKKSRDNFTLRMSNVGRPACQLWYDKNKPEVAIAPPTTFLMNMMIGDIVEAVFKGILKEAGVKYKNSDSVKLELDGTTINGTYDIVIDDAVDDIKSASDWSYKHKFESFTSFIRRPTRACARPSHVEGLILTRSPELHGLALSVKFFLFFSKYFFLKFFHFDTTL